MITVAILINGQPIMARSAVNVAGQKGEVCTYRADDGRIIMHKESEGAVKLAIELLRGIKE